MAEANTKPQSCQQVATSRPHLRLPDLALLLWITADKSWKLSWQMLPRRISDSYLETTWMNEFKGEQAWKAGKISLEPPKTISLTAKTQALLSRLSVAYALAWFIKLYEENLAKITLTALKQLNFTSFDSFRKLQIFPKVMFYFSSEE